jgi:hypothetical protein
MEWIKQRVWQLGIAVLLVLIGAILIYLFGAEDEDGGTVWIGLVLVFMGLFFPLAIKFFEAAEEEDGEAGEN